MGGKKSKPVSDNDMAILRLKTSRDKLQRFRKKLLTTLEHEDEKARELLKQGKRDRARLELKRKRYLEQQLSKLDEQMFSLENLVSSIETAQMNAKVLEGIKAGNEALKSIQQSMSIDEVEKVMEEAADLQADSHEIGEILSRNLSREDEEEVLRELEELEAAAAEDLKASLPSVPTTIPQVEKRKEPTPTIAVAAVAAEADSDSEVEAELAENPRARVAVMA
eukprot:TRINITY_DN12731_c0_g1::TRINITY_DN12731_c0_g1_i1::g.28704::m.28704 TRINITY_DN12731_c0_g1::TRINITY_DN12731_c0_g1_i1::g.28704  ORF type:complete len:223 (-),score=27.09,sp/P0C0A3/CHMP6_MOUSE/41.80/2e-37,Snf7/PF03357.16/4e-40,Snf7/PF03357.16/2.4e+03,PIG-S/PF10510.4/0.0013,PIG-S/PF10510.4/2e+03,Orthopox_A47/PF06334.6/0.0023,YliH/PF10799.3/0.076,DUF1269/PF06897.7/50,DUF1269/PF06897.7/2.5,MutS_III/PF05192.13/8.8 TRINITY_DN12731_c0_g1_i1:408-1076(-)